jgi:hypothetical protein
MLTSTDLRFDITRPISSLAMSPCCLKPLRHHGTFLQPTPLLRTTIPPWRVTGGPELRYLDSAVEPDGTLLNKTTRIPIIPILSKPSLSQRLRVHYTNSNLVTLHFSFRRYRNSLEDSLIPHGPRQSRNSVCLTTKKLPGNPISGAQGACLYTRCRTS